MLGRTPPIGGVLQQCSDHKEKKMRDTRKAALAKIHIAKKQLGMDDATYREMLRSVAGVESAGDLDLHGLDTVLAHLRKVGFKAKGSGRFPGKPQARQVKLECQALMTKVEALLAEAKRPWSYGHGVARQMFNTERLEWLNAQQLHKVVQALMVDAWRHGRYTGG
jgi:phage gp16-like protein